MRTILKYGGQKLLDNQQALKSKDYQYQPYVNNNSKKSHKYRPLYSDYPAQAENNSQKAPYRYVHVHTVVVTSSRHKHAAAAAAESCDVMPCAVCRVPAVTSSSRGCCCCCCCCQERLGCLTLRRATLLAALVSVIFSLLIFGHEVALEGGFNLRNYVVIAFCVVWLIVTSLLVLGTCKRAQFLFLPWMILTCVLTPLFMVGIVAGGKVIATCVEERTGDSCLHEYHLFGTNDHTASSIKLGILLVMFILNSISFLLVYRYFIFLSGQESRKRKQEVSVTDSEVHYDEPHSPPPSSSSVRYERFQDDFEDPETNMPLCPAKDDDDDNRETTT